MQYAVSIFEPTSVPSRTSAEHGWIVFPNVPKLYARLHNPLNTTLLADAAVLRLVKKNDYEPEVLYYDDGSLITILTGAAVDPANHRLIAGGVVEKHFIVCDINDAKL